MSKPNPDLQSLFASAATKPTPTASDPVAVFQGKIQRQLGFLRDAQAGTPVSNRSTWFRPHGAGYTVKIGRDPLDMGNGATLFRADDLQGVRALLEAAHQLVQEDPKLREQIQANAKARKARLVPRTNK
ncbi:hypothetical protein U0C82_08230 [Fulvimarina sp. 2208YS6-2-32]|uniref:Uncharacterized protein n=1 Tax=Fulvimarina uroteuthidis TaxID=3098149 RepID=A0ABU5I4P1_9HYPH|nr:hypothetical protein [Fulvimarina sp. 2208YS6-2-32]MDY8109131.1 hypothetical protein [Fulvimarina sp. 2208YS6-2-32]